MKILEKYMLRCIEIAANGLGSTAPNPAVGAVIVHEDVIIGEGYTSAYGGPHAEVNAINSVKDKTLLKEASLFVTLEPCSHHGKTPPCADLISSYKIPRVVVGLIDPNPLVAGKGIAALRAKNCEVIIGLAEKECKEHHKRFLTFQTKKRPYIILKWAETQDGFVAPLPEKRAASPEPFWITNANSRQLVHQWRAEEQAILVGTNTALEDNPKINVRDWAGKNPFRVVLDKSLKIPMSHNLLDSSTPTLIFTEIENASHYNKGVNYEILDFSKNLPTQILTTLHEYRLTSVLIEGGTITLQTFIDANLWDEARVFSGDTNFGVGIKAPRFSASLKKSFQINSDVLKFYRNA
ncbi:bifunctional diaminohydroxyphosphoribosylaminopyrimidine deaminase/5-amino-6-(5-phosphoribosylamino)uracil reductase RibD [Aggregatimonas sangjinii]|nr:bifunctional diaminohydroxyphosphoribosylaminopyrimidine deaminase/5-amino-6-(5-phosphoribosylamino)uracil reductase RibD [Aggregatimonas sangjinii]